MVISILHIVSVSEQQRDTKEVETVSLTNKCIFGQNKINPLCFYCLYSKYRCVLAFTCLVSDNQVVMHMLCM